MYVYGVAGGDAQWGFLYLHLRRGEDTHRSLNREGTEIYSGPAMAIMSFWLHNISQWKELSLLILQLRNLKLERLITGTTCLGFCSCGAGGLEPMAG